MAGTPDKQRRLGMLDAWSAEILEYVEAGESMRRIAVRLTDKYQEPISEALIGRWFQSEKWGPEVSRARQRAADAKAERVVENATDLVRDVALGLRGRDDIAAIKHEAEQQRWIAGVWNREKYGQQNNATVTVNVANIHLDSLRHAPAVAVSRPPELELFDTDVETIHIASDALTLGDLL